LEGRDYAGATAFLTFQRREAGADSKTLEWLAYSHYHNWEHAQVTQSIAAHVFVTFNGSCIVVEIKYGNLSLTLSLLHMTIATQLHVCI
jgi:hypothetical protein